MKMTLKYIIGTMVSPKKTFERLVEDGEKFTRMWQMLLLMIIGFVIPNLGMVLIKAPSPVPPLLSIIPPEKFYHWILFVGIPAQLPLFIMTTAIVYILARIFKGKAGYENSLAVNMFAVAVPFFLYCAFELGFLLYILITGNTDYGIMVIVSMALFLGATILWQGVTVAIGIRSVHKVKLKAAIIISVLAVSTFAAFAALFFA